MNKIPKWVWVVIAAGAGYYLYNRYKSTTLALTAGTPTVGTPQIPGTTSALASAGQQIGTGITSLFNSF